MAQDNRGEQDDSTSLRALQLKEAEWTQEELQDCVKLIQRYRATYLAAVFASIGWLLAQALQTPANAGSGSTLDALRQRQDIATVLCLIPLLNSFFVVLVFETQYAMQSLARYRFVLGDELGKGQPAWRWDIWKESAEGSVRAWTNPSNVIFGLVALTLPSGALWFGFPAVWNSKSALLWTFWIFSFAVLCGLVMLAVCLGLKNLAKNDVARPIETKWSDLTTQRRSRKRRRLLHWVWK